jgi:hypothetical protein
LKSEFKINYSTLLVDTERTQLSYLNQIKITEDCTCEECKYFATVFVKGHLEIFTILSTMGVDLEKSLKSNPQRLWCVLGANKEFLYCEQMYQVDGEILPKQKETIKYDRIESDYKIEVYFWQGSSEIIEIDLRISKLYQSDKKANVE